ncbi:MAG: hypothetical protein Q8K02_04525 [Flavobacterium sp.]|nr:hypothetical protein [Flavobacterium sp.]
MKKNQVKHLTVCIIYLSILFFVSCKKINNKTEVKFELLNSKIITIQNDSIQYLRRYSDEKEKSLSLNILKYKITNTSSKKLLFVINFDELNEDNFYFQIVDSVSLLKTPNNPLVNFTDVSVPYLTFKMYQDSIKKSNYLNMGIKYKNIEKYHKYISYSFILNPNESKTLQSLLSLPIVEELNLLTHSSPYYFKNLENGDRLFLTYEMNFSDYKDVLQDWQIEELKKNNVEFFEGRLTSNSVPIKLINLKD